MTCPDKHLQALSKWFSTWNRLDRWVRPRTVVHTNAMCTLAFIAHQVRFHKLLDPSNLPSVSTATPIKIRASLKIRRWIFFDSFLILVWCCMLTNLQQATDGLHCGSRHGSGSLLELFSPLNIIQKRTDSTTLSMLYILFGKQLNKILHISLEELKYWIKWFLIHRKKGTISKFRDTSKLLKSLLKTHHTISKNRPINCSTVFVLTNYPSSSKKAEVSLGSWNIISLRRSVYESKIA